MELTPEQKNQVIAIYHKYFDDSHVHFYEAKDINYMWLTFYLANNKNELSYGYWSNDCFNIEFEIGYCFDGYILRAIRKDYLIKPIFNHYNAYDRRDIPFRQIKGDFNKILDGLDRFFNRVHDQIISDLDNNILSDRSTPATCHRTIAELRVIR